MGCAIDLHAPQRDCGDATLGRLGIFLGRLGIFKPRFVKGQFAPLSHALLYRRYELSSRRRRSALLWIAERLNTLVQPKIHTT